MAPNLAQSYISKHEGNGTYRFYSPCRMDAILHIRTRRRRTALFKLGVITDEISQDLDHALDVICEFNMGYVELRSIWGINIADLKDDKISQVKEAIEKRNLKVAAIAGPFLKSDLPGKPTRHSVGKDTFFASGGDYERQLNILRRCLDLAHYFDAPIVRTFAFWRQPAVTDELLEEIASYFDEPLAMVKEAGIKLALENEHECCVGNGDEVRRFLSIIMNKYPDRFASLGIIWDPGNAFFLNETPYPDGYEAVRKDKIIHVHLKDAKIDQETGRRMWAAIGEGQIDLLGQIAALKRDGYDGVLSLETHFRAEGLTPEDATRRSFAGLKRILDQVCS